MVFSSPLTPSHPLTHFPVEGGLHSRHAAFTDGVVKLQKVFNPLCYCVVTWRMLWWREAQPTSKQYMSHMWHSEEHYYRVQLPRWTGYLLMIINTLATHLAADHWWVICCWKCTQGQILHYKMFGIEYHTNTKNISLFSITKEGLQALAENCKSLVYSRQPEVLLRARGSVMPTSKGSAVVQTPLVCPWQHCWHCLWTSETW